MALENREVKDFDRVRMQDFRILHITQGQQEALTVEADRDLDKVYTAVHHGVLILRVGRDWVERLGMGLHTSLTRPHLQYHLTVKNLGGLLVAGAARVEVGDLTTPSLSVELAGASDISIQSLTADQLEVRLSGGGQVEAAGKVQRQRLELSGVGRYTARHLESQQPEVRLSGAGSATVWAVQDLNVNLSGLGSVEYVGNPNVRKRTAGLGSIRPVGQPSSAGTPTPPRPPTAP